MDDLSNQSSGIYAEFINRIQEYYSERNKSIGTCYWDSRSKAFEPHVGHKVLSDMAKGEDAPDILFESEIAAVNTQKIISYYDNDIHENLAINSVIIKTPEKMLNITCKILIDATEYGDILPLANAEYRIGNSISSSIDKQAMIQDITWPAVIRKYPEGIPDKLRPKNSLPNYDFDKLNYENYIAKNGHDFYGVYPITLPMNFTAYAAYRGLPDSFSPNNYTASSKDQHLITKTALNMGNDFPGNFTWKNKSGLPIDYLEDKNLRARLERDALIKTLNLIYFIQNELNESWSVDEDEYNDLPKAAEFLPIEWQEIAKHLLPMPYIRESRRIIGEHTLTSQELYTNSLSYRDGNKNSELQDTIAIGCYTLDLHHANEDSEMENDLNEKSEYMITHKPKGNFQVPMSILIPKNIDGLIAAEKNLSMSRLASGALRLQPITMMTGQAAGTLAALSVIQGKNPREIKALHVQKILLNSGVKLSLCDYSDVKPGSKYYDSIQLANLYKLIEPRKYPEMKSYDISYVYDEAENQEGFFGVNEIISSEELQKLIENAEKLSETKLLLPEMNNITRGEAVYTIIKAMEIY